MKQTTSGKQFGTKETGIYFAMQLNVLNCYWFRSHFQKINDWNSWLWVIFSWKRRVKRNKKYYTINCCNVPVVIKYHNVEWMNEWTTQLRILYTHRHQRNTTKKEKYIYFVSICNSKRTNKRMSEHISIYVKY